MARSNTVIEIKVDQKKVDYQSQIAGAAREVQRDEGEAQDRREKVEKAIEALPEYAIVESAAEALEEARERLRTAMEQAPGLNDLKEDLAFARGQLRSSRIELSNLLLRYTAEFKERSLHVMNQHREIDMTAKLGKEIERQEVLPL